MTPSKEELEWLLKFIYRDILSCGILSTISHVTKRPTPLDKDSERESKAYFQNKFSIRPENKTFLFDDV